MPPLAPVERDNLGVTPDPRCGFGGGGGWVGAAGDPPALAPLQSRIVPGSAGGGGAGPRASGKAGGKAGAGTCWSRLSCWWSCSSRLPVCPCSSPVARAGCIPRGRSRPALPWRGSWIPPLFLLPLPATPGMGSVPSSGYPCLQLQEGLARGVPAGGAGTPQFPPSSQVQGSMTLLPASRSFSPHPCLAPRIPVQPGDASPVTTCWDVRDGWEGCPLSVPPYPTFL